MIQYERLSHRPLITHKGIKRINQPPRHPTRHPTRHPSRPSPPPHRLNRPLHPFPTHKIPIKPFLNFHRLNIIHYGFEHLHQLDEDLQVLVGVRKGEGQQLVDCGRGYAAEQFCGAEGC